MVAVASVVQFTRLNDVISCAVLTALNLTDTSLILLRMKPQSRSSYSAPKLCISLFHLSSLTNAFALSGDSNGWFTGLSLAGMVVSVLILVLYNCRRPLSVSGDDATEDSVHFRTPLVPLWPCAAIWINWYLVVQLDPIGIIGLVGFLTVATVYYTFSKALVFS